MAEGASALHVAAGTDALDEATQLIARGADVNAEDANGDRPLAVSGSGRFTPPRVFTVAHSGAVRPIWRVYCSCTGRRSKPRTTMGRGHW